MRKIEHVTKIFKTFLMSYCIVYDDGKVSFGFFVDRNFNLEKFSGETKFLSGQVCKQIEEKCPNWKKIIQSDIEWLLIISQEHMERSLTDLHEAVIKKSKVSSKKIKIPVSEHSIISRMKLTSS